MIFKVLLGHHFHQKENKKLGFKIVFENNFLLFTTNEHEKHIWQLKTVFCFLLLRKKQNVFKKHIFIIFIIFHLFYEDYFKK